MPPRSAKPRSAKKTAPLAQQENFDDDSEAKVISETETETEKTLNASKKDKSKKKKEPGTKSKKTNKENNDDGSDSISSSENESENEKPTKKTSKNDVSTKKGKVSKKDEPEKKSIKRNEEVETVAIVYDIKDEKNCFHHLDGVPDSVAIENLIEFDKKKVKTELRTFT
jgi:hypothetical protein